MKTTFCILTLLLCFLSSNARSIHDIENNTIYPILKKRMIHDLPVVQVNIEFRYASFKSTDEILVRITLTNNNTQEQNILFDKPRVSTGGPWGTIAKVVSLKTNESVLKHENKAILSSQFYKEEELKHYYYNLKPNESITREFKLRDIVVFDTNDYNLPKGRYEIQLSYYTNTSNSLILIIE